MDSQLASNLLLAVIGGITALGFVGIVAGFWSMGRSGFRKD